MTTGWIYVDTRMEVRDPDHLKVFGSEAVADWFRVHDPDLTLRLVL